MKKVIIAIILMSFISVGLSQKESYHWYYKGGEGLDFSNGAPTLITNGSISASEGTAAISDSLGNLLFYTDGVTIWNANHTQMPNGSGLLGNISTVQSAMIVPLPDSKNIYYVFTVAQTCEADGLNYSVVDMNLENGLGDVIATEKNKPLLSPVFEKMDAVHHCNGKDVWLTCLKSDGDFYSWLITKNGLCNCPVISQTGPVHRSVWGSLKFSNNGKRLVVTDIGNSCSGVNSVHTDLYDFDNNSGIISHYQTIDTAIVNWSGSGGSFWGASFSPNNQVLYLSTGYLSYNGSAGVSTSAAVVQYDLNSPNIESSAVLLWDDAYDPNNPSGGCGSPMGSLQLGIDGRIYVGNTCPNGMGMDVITNPNVLGTGCNYVHGGVPGAIGSGYGITGFIESYFGDGVTSCDSVLSNDMCAYLSLVHCGIQSAKEEAPVQTEINIYPNPGSDHLKIESNVNIRKVIMFDLSGKVVKTIDSGFDILYVSDLERSTYFVRVITDKETITKKFVKQ